MLNHNTYDTKLVAVIESSRSLREAGDRLGIRWERARDHATRLGVRSLFRLGVEKLPSDETLAGLLKTTRAIEPLADRLGVTRALLQSKSEELRIDGRMKVRDGLPDDAELWQALLWCKRFADLAEQYDVPEHTIRNQARRLGVPAPSRRGKRPKRRASR